jgi:hypothetical protein
MNPMKISSFSVLQKYLAPLSLCLGYGFVSYQPAAQAQISITSVVLNCSNEPNGRAILRAEMLVPATRITGHSVTAIFTPESTQKSMVIDPSQEFPNRMIFLESHARSPQRGVNTSGLVRWAGSIPGFSSWAGQTTFRDGEPCNPSPNAEIPDDGDDFYGGYEGSDSGEGLGNIPDCNNTSAFCCSCVGANYGTTEELIGQGTVNLDPAQSAESSVVSANLLALGTWHGTTWAGKGIH